jgi:hypothetical protein
MPEPEIFVFASESIIIIVEKYGNRNKYNTNDQIRFFKKSREIALSFNHNKFNPVLLAS